MHLNKPRHLIALDYEAAAQEYLRSLPLEHFMEATAPATQREITLESVALVKAVRPDLHVYNELLVQYPRPRSKRPGQIVPDNMVVISEKAPKADSSYNLPLEPAGPFCVMEYMSKHNKRKDYEGSFDKYEREAKVPYYLIFYRHAQEMTLYRHNKKKYVYVKPNAQGRHPVPELDMQIELREGWVRFWHRGRLLPLPAEMQRQFDQERQRADELQRLLDAERAARAVLERELAAMRARTS